MHKKKRLLLMGLAAWIVAMGVVIGGIAGVFRARTPEPEALRLTLPTSAPAQTDAPTEPMTAAEEIVGPTTAATVEAIPETTAKPVETTAPKPTEAPSPKPAETTAPTQATPAETTTATVPEEAAPAETTPATAPAVTEPAPEPAPPETAPAEATFTAHTGGTLSYWLYTPAGAGEDLPLLVYLHGGSGKGEDLELVTAAESLPQYLRDGLLGEVEAYVLMPQCPSSVTGWPELASSVYELIQEVVREYAIDGSRVSLTGHSMGGTGTWSLALAYPRLFHRIAPLSGSLRDPSQPAQALRTTAVWAFVGSEDTIVPPQASVSAVEAMRDAQRYARITVFDGAGHFDVPGLAYLDPNLDLLGWLLS